MVTENLRFTHKRRSLWSVYLGRLAEIFFSSLLLFLLTPFFVIIAIAIKAESKGSVFFTQKRGGKDGKHFLIYKFRTMYKANVDVHKVLVDNDPRVTKVGNFLRKTSLDELPQLINILKGDMSFIGPRPTVTGQTDNYNEYQMQRLQLKPGVTGWAQISGRNLLTWDEKIDLDIEYIQKKCFKLDIYILMKTFVKVLKSDEVYIAPKTDKK
ncbi:sugar transferase [Planomicrobium sp. Y74]|uniref:sugar transferase n=1 Tax=Planomicrobium sp. Y74 TaxID=2478977 RepID=UPI000EF541AB|nr:sugar transferase [Planomicrobium sp. Y74]RLQ86626.1 sugar transferase [Planomicrobium sp. Y74]